MAVYLPSENQEAAMKRAIFQASRGGPDRPEMDAQELRERGEAAQAYGREDEPHFVSFLDDCVRTSVQAMTDIRQAQDECWRVYNEEEPYNYAHKETWQSRVIYPKPFKLVQFGMSIVRKAFDVEFLSIENERDDKAVEFWKKLMGTMLTRNYANFPINFVDATGMSLAVGQSMEMIPVWRPGKGLRYILVEPWKIHRDPDAVSRQPQSGMYWIHQEYMPYHLLKEWEREGRFVNIGDFGPAGSWGQSQDPNLSETEIARRKAMVWSKSTYQKAALTSEFWGTVLDRRGEMLLPNASFTTAGGRVIGLPKVSPYPTLRWPGIGFSALPHLLRFDGRGLIQGIKSLWYLMCNLMSLHADHLNWMVNPMIEVDVQSLVDQRDVDVYPGKIWQTHGSAQGQQVVRATDIKSQVGEAIAILNFYDQRHQDGGLMDYSAMGAPGYRAEVTAREAAQNLDQSMTIVGSMGKNLEDGALNAILAGAETVAINITYEELAMLMGPEVADQYRVPVSPEFPTGLNLPQLTTGNFRVAGISALMKDAEIWRNIRDVILPMSENPLFQPYLKPYSICLSTEKRLQLQNENVFVDQDTADRVDTAQQVQQEAAIKAQQAAAAAEAALAEMKAQSEQAKAEMNLAKAKEHEGKAALALAKAEVEGRPEPGTGATGVEDEFKPDLTLAQAELTQRQADTEAAKVQLILAQAKLALAQAKAALRPPPAPASNPGGAK
jgi:hypothetical protein